MSGTDFLLVLLAAALVAVYIYGRRRRGGSWDLPLGGRARLPAEILGAIICIVLTAFV